MDSLVWTVPDVGTDSAAVRVTAYDAAAHSTADLSDGLFHIVGPTGVPAGGEGTSAYFVTASVVQPVVAVANFSGSGQTIAEVKSGVTWQAGVGFFRAKGEADEIAMMAGELAKKYVEFAGKQTR